MIYPHAEEVFAIADARVELAKALAARFEPIADSPADTYLRHTRRLPADAVRTCEDLRHVPPPIEGRPPQDHALVSLLRDAAGEVSGFQLEFCDIAGARTATEPFKQTYSLRENGVRDGLFRAGGTGETAFLTEGYSCKALAIASLGLGPVYGGGGLTVLGFAVPPEDTVVIVPDRRPDGTVVDFKTGTSAAAEHDVGYKRAVDRLVMTGKVVRLAKVPDCQHPGGGACSDADAVLRQHGNVRLRELVESVEDCGLSLDGEARKLAQLDDPLERDQATKAKAAELKVKVALLRDRVAHYRDVGPTDTTTPLPGAEVTFADIRPWPHPVDGTKLIAALQKYINDHVEVSEQAALTSALWAVHCHAHDAAYHTPRLVLRSPTKGCGKSTLRRVIARCVPRPFEAIDITGPTLFRPIGQWAPLTVFVDEADEIHWGEARDLRAVINSGHCRDDPGVPRCVGESNEVRQFRVWAPLCLALIGYLPTTIAERSIIVEMRKKPRGTPLARLVRRDRDERARQLASQAARWAADHILALTSAEPEMPRALGDRPADNWRALLAIADLIDLGEQARAAAVTLSVTDDDDDDLAIQLAADILTIFEQDKRERLPSSLIITRLLAMEGRPWPEMPRTGRPLSTHGLARLLRPFKIRPAGTLRFGSSTSKGYARSAFAEMWKQYGVEGGAPEKPSQRHNAGAEPVSADSKPSQSFPGVTDRNGHKATGSATCDAVSVKMTSPSPPLEEEHSDGEDDEPATDGAQPAETITLTCSTCSRAFNHDAHRPGQRPGRCPKCRGGGAHIHERVRKEEEATMSADEVVDQVRAGTRCTYCGMPFTDLDEPVKIQGKLYHSDDACAGTIRRRIAAEAAG